MSQGQIILTLGAVVLFMYTALQVNRNYLNAVQNTTEHQRNLDAINFGLSVAERLYRTDFEDLLTDYGDFDDETDPEKRILRETQAGDELYATIGFIQKELLHGVEGIIATIDIYSFRDSTYHLESQNTAGLAPF